MSPKDLKNLIGYATVVIKNLCLRGVAVVDFIYVRYACMTIFGACPAMGLLGNVLIVENIMVLEINRICC